MTKKQIIDYIMNSPENTNPAILNQMIDEISGGGSGDFSTCTGTFICDNYTSNGGLTLTYAACVLGDTSYGLSGEPIDADRTITFILYNGHCNAMITQKTNGNIVSMSGGIENTSYDDYDITGDFTIHCIGSQEILI